VGGGGVASRCLPGMKVFFRKRLPKERRAFPFHQETTAFPPPVLAVAPRLKFLPGIFVSLANGAINATPPNPTGPPKSNLPKPVIWLPKTEPRGGPCLYFYSPPSYRGFVAPPPLRPRNGGPEPLAGPQINGKSWSHGPPNLSPAILPPPLFLLPPRPPPAPSPSSGQRPRTVPFGFDDQRVVQGRPFLFPEAFLPMKGRTQAAPPFPSGPHDSQRSAASAPVPWSNLRSSQMGASIPGGPTGSGKIQNSRRQPWLRQTFSARRFFPPSSKAGPPQTKRPRPVLCP